MNTRFPKINNIPEHVAIIMDGNGRWAKENNLSRIHGHKEGTQSVRSIMREAASIGIKYLTFFTFSTENWSRPKLEIDGLMKLLIDSLITYEKELHENSIRLQIMGETNRLPKPVQKIINKIVTDTKDYSVSNLILALNYGGRFEITKATKEIALKFKNNDIDITEINENMISDHLYLPKVPDPDLVIRTSGEMRLSNFMLWQLSYSEIVITDKFWPDFKEEDFYKALKEYESRNRRYGNIG
jgi:undecaprenyl diphosphate synthase|tara:strand:- start:326 stop:1051 length:726 start_codon:yes stop_codon:yes gene_type:complete